MKISVDPLLAETVPDGTFGGARTRPRDTRPVRWSRADQARHRAELIAALSGWRDNSERATRDRERHWPRPTTRPTTERTAS